MMLLPNPKRLMLGYLLGALMTSITLRLVIVFSLQSSAAVTTTENTLSPAATMALGGIALATAVVLGTGRHRAIVERRQARKKIRVRALAAGAGKRFGADHLRRWGVAHASRRILLAGLSRIHRLNYASAETVALVVALNVIMPVLLEVPPLRFAIAPSWPVGAIDRAKAWIWRHGRRSAVIMLTVLGGLLVTKGLIELPS